MNAKRSLGILALVFVIVTLPRCIHLEADTPPGVSHGSMGIYVDEGYKTLDARNLSLFGRIQWNPNDDFAGWWMKRSPVTQSLYYLAFELFGAELGAARSVAIAFYLSFLLGFAIVHWRRLPPGLLALGVVLLGLEYTLFAYSRVALFISAVIAFCYLAVLSLTASWLASPARRLSAVSVMAVAASLGVKESALLYFMPVLAGILLAMAVEGQVRRKTLLTATVLAGGVASVVAFLTRDSWLWRVDLEQLTDLRGFALNPMTESSSLLLAVGFLSAAHAILVMPRRFLGSAYRSSLLLLCTLGPLSLALFPYNPLRYYVPFLPAYILLFIEWVRLKVWEKPLPERLPRAVLPFWLLLFGWGLLCLGKAASQYLLGGLEIWNEMKTSGRVLFPWAEVAMLAVVVWIWVMRRRILKGKPLLMILGAILAFSLSHDVYKLGEFLFRPSYQSRQISASIENLISEGQSLEGDWAPFFALGTDIPALSMGAGANLPNEIPSSDLGASFFLFSDTDYGRALLEVLRLDGTVRVEDSIMESEYMGYKVALHPLSYDIETKSSASD